MRTIDQIELDYKLTENMVSEQKLQLLKKIGNDIFKILQVAARDWNQFSIDVMKRVNCLYPKVTRKINRLEAHRSKT